MSSKHSIWGLGLDPKDRSTLDRIADEDRQVTHWEKEKLPSVKDFKKASPLLAFVPLSLWEKLSPQKRGAYKRYGLAPFVLVMDNDHNISRKKVEHLFTAGFMSVLGNPLTGQKLEDVYQKAIEVRYLYQDIYYMTQEIALERELLTRKNAQLSFLYQLMTRATGTLEPTRVLMRIKNDLNQLLKVKEVGAVFWESAARKVLEADLFIPGNGKKDAQEDWIEYLLNTVSRMTGKNVNSYHLNFSENPKKRNSNVRPEPGKTILFPLQVGNEQFGSLVIVSDEAVNLGKDRLDTLKAAVQHLSLALKNAIIYLGVKNQADHDGLTRIHNRQHFDDTLVAELKRHQRYHQSLSLLMLDLDHFKQINDVYGHQAGDMVLREIGRLLTTTLRESDYPARYGGEEFVILLPQTTENQAWHLAERIRKKLARTKFTFEKQNFQVTTSIGIASVKPGSLHPPAKLVRMADKALYAAKAAGRNIVCASAPVKKETLPVS